MAVVSRVSRRHVNSADVMFESVMLSDLTYAVIKAIWAKVRWVERLGKDVAYNVF